MSAAARAAVPAAQHCPPDAARRVAPAAPTRARLRRAPLRAVALRVVAGRSALSSGGAARAPRGAPERDRRAPPSLDAFLAQQGGAGALLGYAVVHSESGRHLGTVREVLTVAGGEVVFTASGDGAAAADGDEERLLSALAGLGDWAAPVASSAESTLLRVEGAGCVAPTPARLPPSH